MVLFYQAEDGAVAVDKVMQIHADRGVFPDVIFMDHQVRFAQIPICHFVANASSGLMSYCVL